MPEVLDPIELDSDDPYRISSLPPTPRASSAQVQVVRPHRHRLNSANIQIERRASRNSSDPSRLLPHFCKCPEGIAITVSSLRRTSLMSHSKPRGHRPLNTLDRSPVEEIESGSHVRSLRSAEGINHKSPAVPSQSPPQQAAINRNKRKRMESITIDDEIDELADSSKETLPRPAKKIIQSDHPPNKTLTNLEEVVKGGNEFQEVQNSLDWRQSIQPLSSVPLPSDKLRTSDGKILYYTAAVDESSIKATKGTRLVPSPLPESQIPPRSTSAGKKIKTARDTGTNIQEIFQRHNQAKFDNEVESPDALQGDKTSIKIGSDPKPEPMFEGSSTALARSIDISKDKSGTISTYFSTKGLEDVHSKTKQAASPKGPKKAKPGHMSSFDLKSIAYSLCPDFDRWKIVLNDEDRTFAFKLRDSFLEPENLMQPIKVQKIFRIWLVDGGSSQLVLEMSRTAEQDNKICLELSSDKDAWDLVKSIQHICPDIQIQDREQSWMKKCFARKREADMHVHKSCSAPEHSTKVQPKDAPLVPSNLPSRNSTQNNSRPRRLTDRLGLSPHDPETGGSGKFPQHRTIITGKDRMNNAMDEADHYMASTNQSNVAERPQRGNNLKLRNVISDERQTRSSDSRNIIIDDDSGDLTKMPKMKYSHSGKLGQVWTKPFVYPKAGKKRETVEFKDLERLDTGEFLNDNLIGFFLRYLQHYLEREKPDLATKVYFFNSYFYERLTQTQKGKRGINYDAVQKWTRSVDIFRKDFIIVPVNENFHWYVAIICNLTIVPRMFVDVTSSEDKEERDAQLPLQAPESIFPKTTALERDDPGNSNNHRTDDKARESLEKLSLSDDLKVPATGTQVLLSESEAQPRPSMPKTKGFGSGRRKSAHHSLPKHDPAVPIIVTLDSLDLSRTATCSALRQYIVEEGNQKRGLEIDGKAIKGMTAKGIPTQKNFSDCGLFLCAYMEKFVMDPYAFTGKILQREMDGRRDIPVMSSEELRNRLRDLIVNLHREQEREKPLERIPEIGSILLGKERTPSPDIQSEDELALADSLTTGSTAGLVEAANPEDAMRAINQVSPTKVVPAQTEGSVIFIDDDTPNDRNRSQMMRSDTDREKIEDFVQYDDYPARLAEEMRQGCSSERYLREPSASTDFLTTNKSYTDREDEELREVIPESPKDAQMPNSADDPQEILHGV